jgi:transcriptional regulator with XRE-family HTH domain
MTIDQVKDRIKLLGLKKQHVAEQIGIDSVRLSYYLNNKRDLDVNVKEKLRIYLKL